MTQTTARPPLTRAAFDQRSGVTYRPCDRPIISRDISWLKFMVEILCTVTGIVAGVAIVASLMHSKGDVTRWLAPKPEDDLERPDDMRGIADQLRLLTFRVAADVTAHNERVEAISGRLTEPSADSSEHILSAINELISANQQMQGQLADARKRIADQSELIEEAAQQARIDALTGLANRRALNEFLQSCLDAIQPGETAGLVLLDIDHFKAFNDTYGHTTGDAVLAAFARNLKRFCKQECYAARYGGEEFAVILTGRDGISLAQKAAGLRKFVSEQSIGFESLQLKITASAGLSLLSPGESLQAACERSDEGLYRAKKAGRNQGYWLNGTRWQPFPAESSCDAVQREKALDAQTLIRQTAVALERRSESAVSKASATETAERSPVPPIEAASPRSAAAIDPPAAPAEDRPETAVEGPKKSLGEVLDLATFMNRTAVYFEQLRRADLPATGMLVEAQWDLELEGAENRACWNIVLGLIQSQLRGIDVVCVYRENTAGIFLPGCSIEAATERASRIQMMLETSRKDWQPQEHCPDRLAISIAQALEKEETGEFLQRLDDALAEAAAAGRFELIIHNGQSTRLESTIQA